MALLESILREGKKIMAAAGITVTLACTPAVRAQRDYDLYPDRKAEIALYNMRQIAGQICGTPSGLQGETYYGCKQMSFSQQGIEYVSTDCIFGTGIQRGCLAVQNQTYFMEMDKIRKIVPTGNSVKVCSEGERCITINRFKSSEQAADFAEAMNIYVMER